MNSGPGALAHDGRFGLIVIGGGINGVAIAREAAVSGVDVALLERDDLGAGTSAASTRLIHGGLRYLEHAEFALVRESLAEREQLLASAPHLVEPLEIVLPLNRESRRGPMLIRVGMWLYDLLSYGKSLPGHRMLSPRQVSELLPGIETSGLRGGAAYFDAQVRYPERLVLENALDAINAGACIATRTEARELLVADGRVTGVVWESAAGRGVAHAPVVVNAAGPWVDDVLGPLGGRKLIGGTRGSHLVTEVFTGAPPRAVYAEAGSDGRPFFVIPWNGLCLIGTTDERDDGDPGAAAMSRAEYDYLVRETRRLFPGAADLEQRVCYTYAGIRPLPNKAGVRPGAITRRHLIEAHASVAGLYSIVGGKLTTHRALAADCLHRLRRELPGLPPSPTVGRRLPGGLDAASRDELLADLAAAFGQNTAGRLWRTYGGLSSDLLARVAAAPDLGRRIGSPDGPIAAEFVRALEVECASGLVDLMQRRTMLGLAADFGRRLAPLAANELVRLGVWDQTRAADEVDRYAEFSRRFEVPV